MSDRLPNQLVETPDSLVLSVAHRDGSALIVIAVLVGFAVGLTRTFGRCLFAAKELVTEGDFDGVERRKQIDCRQKLDVVESLRLNG